MNKTGIVLKQKGMTLVEIMVALVLGIFLIAGVIHIFLGSKQTYRMQENLARLQENGRFAMDFISRDIRMADSWGCLKNGLAGVSNKKKYATYKNGISGAEAANMPDEITLVAIEGGKSTSVASQTAIAGNITVTGGNGFAVGDTVLIADCNQGDIFKISGVTGGKVLAQNLTGGQDISKIYGADASIYPLKATKYSIQNDVLYRTLGTSTPEPLVEGVEDMHIRYGVDTDKDYTPNYYVSTNQVPSDDWDKIVSVRIRLIVATLEDNLATIARPYQFFNGTTKTDKKMRHVFSSTIAVRNRLP